MTTLNLLPRFRAARRALDTIAGYESWSRVDLDAYQLERLNALWSRAIKNSRHYHDLAAEHRLPDRFDSLEDFTGAVPVLDKQTIRANPQNFFATDAERGSWHRTGGSTGVPLRIFWSDQAHREMLWRKYRLDQAWGLDFLDRRVFLWGHAASFAPGMSGKLQRLKRPWVDRLRNRLRLNAYRLSDEDLQRYLEQIVRFDAKSIYGYSSAVGLLAEAAARAGHTEPLMRLAILTAEPAMPVTIAACRQTLVTDVAIEYGSVECGLIATGMPDGSLRVRDDVIFLEALPTDDGVHELVVTVLNNPSFPLIRYRIGDTTPEPLTEPDRGLKILHGVAGRTVDYLIAKSGRRVHPLAVKHALERFTEAGRFRAHQGGDGGVTLTLETAVAPPQDVQTDALGRLGAVLEGQPIELQTVDRLEANAAGKHRWITSDLT